MNGHRRAGVLLAVALVVGGTVWLLVAGSDALRFWGYLRDPECLDDGTCTSQTLDDQIASAWWRLLPGGLLVVTGLALAVGVARGVPAGVGLRPGRHRGRVGRVLAAATLGVEVVAVGPVFLGLLVGPPLGVALLIGSGVGLVAILTLVTAGRVGLRDAVPVAVASASAAAVGGSVVVAGSWVTVRLAVLVLLALVPPVCAAGVGVLTLRALGDAPRPTPEVRRGPAAAP